MISISHIIYTTIILMRFNIEAKETYRLNHNVYPNNYKLNISINPKEDFFFGTIEIDLSIDNRTTKLISLHADRSYITIEKVLKKGESCITKTNKYSHLFNVTCPTEFKSGDILLLSYRGKFSIKTMYGLYKSTYDNGALLVATFLQPTFARRVFPCFDEPSFKATYELTIVHPSNYSALANTPLEVATVIRNVTVSKFQKTPLISSYLIAFIVSEFKGAFEGDRQFNVFARPSAARNMEIAKKNGQKLFDSMSRWTGIRYDELGNPQAYLAAIPDSSAGGMENWGLITFSEVNLLDEGNKTSESSFQNILMVMAHEIAHQWFGNYVTLDWWSDTWLNEGLATYFSYRMVDEITGGSLEMENQFINEELQTVLEKDATISTIPISSPVNSFIDIVPKFESITYFKGAGVVRMMKFILGEDVLQKGLQSYLLKNKYKNVNPEILLQHLQSAAGEEILNFDQKMHNWIYRGGFPLLTVSRKSATTVIVTQERFFSNKTLTTKDQWYVPLSYTNETTKDFSVKINGWLEPDQFHEIPHSENHWLILNIQQSGYYRVNYDDILWNHIVNALHSDVQRESIHSLNRAKLIDDIFHVARIGKVRYEKAFDLVRYLKNEHSYYPWVSALREISFLLQIVDDETNLLLKNFVLDLITSAFPSDTKYVTHIEKLKENLISKWRCKLGEKKCIEFAKSQFKSIKMKNELVNHNKRSLVFCYGLKNSENLQDDYNFLFNVLKNTQSPSEKVIIYSALGCMENEPLLTKYLNLTLSSNSTIRQQDYQIVFSSVYQETKIGIDVALNFLERNLKLMEKTYGGGALITDLMTDLAAKLSTPAHTDQMKRIIDAYIDDENVQQSKATVLEIVGSNSMWNKEYGSEIKNVLKHYKSSNSPKYSYYVNFMVFISVFVSFYIIV